MQIYIEKTTEEKNLWGVQPTETLQLREEVTGLTCFRLGRQTDRQAEYKIPRRYKFAISVTNVLLTAWQIFQAGPDSSRDKHEPHAEYVSPYANDTAMFGKVNWLFRARYYLPGAIEI